MEEVWVRVKIPVAERRRWQRLPLAIPVFVRSRIQADKEFLEFATALNVSAGGMLVAVRRALPFSSQVSLEIPSAPLAAMAMFPKVARNVRAKVLRTEHAAGFHLLGLKFSKPLLAAQATSNSHAPAKAPRRKLASAM
jgi:c-di-GMP-binding flagellar brake protein YcgR